MRNQVRHFAYCTCALTTVITAVACGSVSSAAPTLAGTSLIGRGFTMTVATAWTASAPQDQAGGTTYQITGPSHSQIEIAAFPTTMAPVAGVDLAHDSLQSLLTLVGHQSGTTVLSTTPPSTTTLGGEPGMSFGSTLLSADGVSQTQNVALDTRHGAFFYIVFIESSADTFAANNSAGQAMMATWRWR
jgi:hypothetical protein